VERLRAGCQAVAAGYDGGDEADFLIVAPVPTPGAPPALSAFLRGSGPGFPAWPARFIILAGTALAGANYVVLGFLDLTGPEPTLEGELADLDQLEP